MRPTTSLWTLARVGLVWDLKTPPLQGASQRAEAQWAWWWRGPASSLAGHFDPEQIAHAIMAALPAAELSALADALSRTTEVLATLRLPQIPSREEVFSRATAIFVSTRSLDDIVDPRLPAAALASVSARLSGLLDGPQWAALASAQPEPSL